MSVAVYRLDSLSAAGGADITSYLRLAADLRGTIENPSRYFDATNPDAAAAADNLMLTQGWRRFRWAAVLAGRPDSLPYPPELHGPIVRGRVVNRLTNAPVAGIPVFLASPSRRPQLYNSISQPDGGVQFELAGPLRLPPISSADQYPARQPKPRRIVQRLFGAARGRPVPAAHAARGHGREPAPPPRASRGAGALQ
ncbi:MAG: hypothetical protein WKG07_36840 [Hymenobacter sp.]